MPAGYCFGSAPLIAMPRSWLTPAVVVQRSALALSRTVESWGGVIVSVSLDVSIGIQVIPSLASEYCCSLEALDKVSAAAGDGVGVPVGLGEGVGVAVG